MSRPGETAGVTAIDPRARVRGVRPVPKYRTERRAPPAEAACAASTKRTARKRGSPFAWGTWLLRGGIATGIGLAGIALFAPHGTLIAACILMVLGSAMVLVGYGVGAYAAFGEDFLYGFFYLVIPLYTAYYLVTRWEDLWAWFACSTAGVVSSSSGSSWPVGAGWSLDRGPGALRTIAVSLFLLVRLIIIRHPIFARDKKQHHAFRSRPPRQEW